MAITTTSKSATTATALTPATAGPRHVLGMAELADDAAAIIATGLRLKALARRGALPQLLAGKAVVVIFEKSSTRTRVSFEIGIQRLGGVVSILDAKSSQMGRGESIEDTAKVLSRYADAIVYRADSHAACCEMALHSTVPVVNALTDLEHPCQVLADLATLQEHFGTLTGRTLAYVGDGNNMCHSYLLGAPLVGLDIRVATPKGYEPSLDVVMRAKALGRARRTKVHVDHDAARAVTGVDAVATDTWVSMGDEDEAAERAGAFKGFTVDEELMQKAAPGAVFIHCLPGHWGSEATYDVAHGPRSLIYDEAENRMWVQMALLVHLLAPSTVRGLSARGAPSR